MKAATINNGNAARTNRISIHAAREGGDVGIIKLISKFKISIHAAREGGDSERFEANNRRGYFNPRRP